MSYVDPTLDPEEQAIMAALTPEGAEPGTPASDLPTADEADPAAAPAPNVAPTSAEPAAAPAAAAPAEPAAAPAADPAQAPAQPAEPPGGDPRAALRHARRNEKRLLNEVEALRKQLEDAKAGRSDPAAPKSVSDMTEAELRDLEENFPLQAQLVREVRELRQRTAPQAQAPTQPQEWEAPVFNPEVQEVIDQVPTLLSWQLSQADQDKFQMAAEFDTSLRADPIWKNKPAVERFAEATRRTQAALGVAAPAQAPAPANRQDPALVIANAPARVAAGISDFRGGGPASAPAVDYSRLSDEQILASLVPDA